MQTAVVPVTDLKLAEVHPFGDEMNGPLYHEYLARAVDNARRNSDLDWLAVGPGVAYLVLEREAAEFFLRSRSVAFPGPAFADLFGVTSGPLREEIDWNILNQRGDRHRRMRALVSDVLTVRAAAALRPAMRGILSRLWDGLGGRNNCDLTTEIAGPYASQVITGLLGAPAADAPALLHWSGQIQRQFDILALATPGQIPIITQATQEAYEYVEKLLDEREAAPRGDGDLLTILLAATRVGRLSRQECVNLVHNVVSAGIDTSRAQLSHAVRWLAAYPDQWELIRQQPRLVPQAVEEALRYEPVTPLTARICLKDITYQNVLFPAGTILAISTERCNRDQPGGEEFDITAKREQRLMTFGGGLHFCVGQHLARAEMEEALGFLAPRMPGLESDGPAVVGNTMGIYGVQSLPVRWAITSQ